MGGAAKAPRETTKTCGKAAKVGGCSENTKGNGENLRESGKSWGGAAKTAGETAKTCGRAAKPWKLGAWVNTEGESIKCRGGGSEC